MIRVGGNDISVGDDGRAGRRALVPRGAAAVVAASCVAAWLLLSAVLYAGSRGHGLPAALLLLSGVTFTCAAFAVCKFYIGRVSAQARASAELAHLHLATVEALATAIDAKDQTTHCHVRRVQLYAAGMGRALGLPAPHVEALRAGALLHDIGKLAVPDHILNKAGKLSPAEFERMKVHTIVGAQILEKINFPHPVVAIVRHHHERWDGLGYPDGLAGEDIPLAARVFAVVDCYDSVREERPFRPGMGGAEAGELIRRGAGTHFDPRVVETFLARLPEFEAELGARGLAHQPPPDHDETGATRDASAEAADDLLSSAAHPARPCPQAMPSYFEHIKNAHREICALYEIASTFGSSLDITHRAAMLADKLGGLVPYDTCVIYLYDELQGCARVAHAAGAHAETLCGRTAAPGEGVVGLALASRRPATDLDPMLDFDGIVLPPGAPRYRAVIALPLLKEGRLLGALAVY
ncbi:MAG: HD domain-containing phosphohydrolase, partial [Pyrinomonadaceae bacterium]